MQNAAMLAIAAGRSAPSRASPAVALRLSLACAGWTGRAMIPEPSRSRTLRPVSSLTRRMVHGRFPESMHCVLKIAVATPASQHLVGGRAGNGFVELQHPLDLALRRRRIVGA